MLFQWNEQTFELLAAASAYTGYDRELAKLLKKELGGCRTLCDIGCGMGLADLEIAPELDSVTCADISQAALDDLEKRAAARGVGNIRTICTDGMKLKGEWDAVTALFHGEVEDIVPAYLKLAKKKLIVVTHGSAYGTTGPKEYRVRKCCDVDSTVEWLDRHGYRYTLTRGELEFGQPHKSLEDALSYTRLFTKNAPEDELEAHVRATVTETGREDYPLYTPKKRGFGIFVIGRQENEHVS